jgi:hypothetical protein
MNDGLAAMAQASGFADVLRGYQAIPVPGAGQSAFASREMTKGFAFWLVLSGGVRSEPGAVQRYLLNKP